MSLCSGTSGIFLCPNSVVSLKEIHCCGISGIQFCCDYDTYSNVFTRLGTPVLAGIIIGVLLLIIGSCVCCCWCCKCCCFSHRRQPPTIVVPTSDMVNFADRGYHQVLPRGGGGFQPVETPLHGHRYPTAPIYPDAVTHHNYPGPMHDARPPPYHL